MTAIISSRSFGVHIRTARRSKEWSLAELTKEANRNLPENNSISRQMLSKYERGDLRKAPSAEKRSALCEALSVVEADLKEVPTELTPEEIDQKLKDYDVLPLLKKVAGFSSLKNLTFEQLRCLCEANELAKKLELVLTLPVT